MKMSPVIFVLGVLHVTWNVPIEAEPRFGVPELPREPRQLGFVLAQGLSGEQQAVLPGYTREQGLFDGEMEAEFKGTKRWWLSGYISGLSIVGLVVQSEYFADRSDASLSKEAYQAIRRKGINYIEGFRNGYKKRIREKREASNTDGSFWGIGTLTGVLTASAILLIVD